MRKTLLALAIPALMAAGPEIGDAPLCKVGFLQIVSPDAVTMRAEQCRAVAKQTKAAWDFDADQMRWAHPAEMESPLTLRLLSVDRMKSEHPGVIGFAKGRDLFVVSLSILSDPFANGTLAHELAHIQAKRALGKRSEQRLVPRYFLEGHGNRMGLAYRDQLRVANHDYDARKARQIAKLTANETKIILTDDSYGSGDKKKDDIMESMGIFFVEYLRLRHQGKGEADILPRMGRVFEAVGSGQSYQNAFREQFKASVDEIVADIVAFMARTESLPKERLKGTRYEEFLKLSSSSN